MAVAGAVAWGAVGLWFGIVVSAWDAADAHDVTLTGWFLRLASSDLALAGGVVSYLVVGRVARTATSTALGGRTRVATPDRPVAVLAAGEPAVWSRRLTSVLLAVAGGIPLGRGGGVGRVPRADRARRAARDHRRDRHRDSAPPG